MAQNTMTSGHDPANQEPLYVFEAPVRIWHWVHAATISVLAVTGYLIANPLPALQGEAGDHFLMGTIRMIHFIAAYVFMIGFLVRCYWAFVGNRYSRQLFIVPFWRAAWWKGLWYELRLYSFTTRKLAKTPAHNPLAQTAIFFFNVVLVIFMICTGLALYSQGLGADSWADTVAGWVFLFGSSQEVRMWHLLGMWLMVVFVVVHVYMGVRADLIGRQSSVSTIVSGWRTYKDDLPGDPR